MGEAAVAVRRREVEQTRERLGGDVDQLRARMRRFPARSTLVAGAAGTLAIAAAVGAVLLAVRRRSPVFLRRGIDILPERLRRPAQAPARRGDRRIGSLVSGVGRRRQRALDAMTDRLAAAIVAEQKRQDPMIRKVATAAATTAAVELVRRSLNRRTDTETPVVEAQGVAQRDRT